jgi:hypothetical protein
MSRVRESIELVAFDTIPSEHTTAQASEKARHSRGILVTNDDPHLGCKVTLLPY